MSPLRLVINPWALAVWAKALPQNNKTNASVTVTPLALATNVLLFIITVLCFVSFLSPSHYRQLILYRCWVPTLLVQTLGQNSAPANGFSFRNLCKQEGKVDVLSAPTFRANPEISDSAAAVFSLKLALERVLLCLASTCPSSENDLAKSSQ